MEDPTKYWYKKPGQPVREITQESYENYTNEVADQKKRRRDREEYLNRFRVTEDPDMTEAQAEALYVINQGDPDDGYSSLDKLKELSVRYGKPLLTLVGAGAVVGAAAVGTGVKLGDKKFERSRVESQNVLLDRQDLAPEGEVPDVALEIAGQAFNNEGFKNLLGIVLDNRLTTQQIEYLMQSYASMIQVEASFGSDLNVNPFLEDVTVWTGGLVEAASSFGVAQISPFTAKGLALEYQEQLIATGLLSADQLEQIEAEPDPVELVQIMNLRGDENLVYGILAFLEGLERYGRINGELRVNPERFGRAYNLAVAAYSATIESPANAKLQTYLAEIVMVNPEVHNKLSAVGINSISIDGDVGPGTQQALEIIAEHFQINLPEDASNQQLIELLRPTWANQVEGVSFNSSEALADYVLTRYSSTIGSYVVIKQILQDYSLTGYIPKLEDLFRSYINTRTKDYRDILANQESFADFFELGEQQSLSFEMFQDLQDALNQRLEVHRNFDEPFPGYIPVAYASPTKIGADPRNVMSRLIIGHEEGRLPTRLFQDSVEANSSK